MLDHGIFRNGAWDFDNLDDLEWWLDSAWWLTTHESYVGEPTLVISMGSVGAMSTKITGVNNPPTKWDEPPSIINVIQTMP